jgi:hypothetical protein
LTELTASVQGELSEARALHATGVVGGDSGRLHAAVAAFERIGSPLLAAEAALDVVDAAVVAGDRTAADAASERARQLRGLLGPHVHTPRLSQAR